MEPIIVTRQAEMDKVPKGFYGVVEVRSSADEWIQIPSGIYVEAYDSAQVEAYDSAHVTAYGSAQVEAYGSAHVTAYGSAQVEAYGSAQVRAYGSAQVRAYDSAHVTAYGSAQVTAYGSAQVEAYGNVQILNLSARTHLTTRGNARIVTLPDTPEAYCDYYGVEVRDGVAILHKAVNANLIAFYDGATQYTVGEQKTNTCDPSRDVTCSTGLHVAHMDWAIRFGMGESKDFRLIEVAVPLDKMVVPKNTDGKVRTSELTVLREVPRDEWGFYANWKR